MEEAGTPLTVLEGNRRQSRRRPARDIPYLGARLVGGPPVELLDVSRRGILFQTSTRLHPGSPIAVKLVAADAGMVLRGSVVRSTVAVLNGAEVKYHTAVAFDDDITLCDEGLWTEEVEEGPPGPADSTAPGDDSAGGELAVVATFEGDAGSIEDLLAGNDW